MVFGVIPAATPTPPDRLTLPVSATSGFNGIPVDPPAEVAGLAPLDNDTRPVRQLKLEIRRRVLDLAINTRDQEGKYLRHLAASKDIKAELQQLSDNLEGVDDNDARRLAKMDATMDDLRGRLMIAEAGMAASQWKRAQWTMEIEELRGQYYALPVRLGLFQRLMRG